MVLSYLVPVATGAEYERGLERGWNRGLAILPQTANGGLQLAVSR